VRLPGREKLYPLEVAPVEIELTSEPGRKMFETLTPNKLQ
jgi:hypothetical protein